MSIATETVDQSNKNVTASKKKKTLLDSLDNEEEEGGFQSEPEEVIKKPAHPKADTPDKTHDSLTAPPKKANEKEENGKKAPATKNPKGSKLETKGQNKDEAEVDSKNTPKKKDLKTKKKEDEEAEKEEDKEEAVKENQKTKGKKGKEKKEEHVEDEEDEEEAEEEEDDEEDEEEDDEEDEDEEEDDENLSGEEADGDDDEKSTANDEEEADESDDQAKAGDVTKNKRRKKKGYKEKKFWEILNNQGDARFVKVKHFENILNMVLNIRVDDLGPKLKFSETAKTTLQYELYQKFNSLISMTSKLKSSNLHGKNSGKKIKAEDILAVVSSNPEKFGFMDPGVFLESSDYTSNLIYLEVLSSLMGYNENAPNDEDEDEDEETTEAEKTDKKPAKDKKKTKAKEENDQEDEDEQELVDVPPTILPGRNGFAFKHFDLVMDASRSQFDHKSGTKRPELAKSIFPSSFMEDPDARNFFKTIEDEKENEKKPASGNKADKKPPQQRRKVVAKRGGAAKKNKDEADGDTQMKN